MLMERVSEYTPEEAGEYSFDEWTWNVYISVYYIDFDSKDSTIGLVKTEDFFPRTEIWENEIAKLNFHIERWYKVLWEVESDKTIRENLQVFLSSGYISDVVILKRESPNNHLILWKITELSTSQKVLSWINSQFRKII